MAKDKDWSMFDKYLLINKDNLDVELVRQAQVFYQVAEQYVLACSQRDQAKENIATTSASLAIAEREVAVGMGKKITEAGIQEYVITHEDYQDAAATYRKLKEEAELLGARREAFLQRSFMLRDLASLHVSGYFMSSSVAGAQAGEIGKQAYERDRAGLKEGRKKLRS